MPAMNYDDIVTGYTGSPGFASGSQRLTSSAEVGVTVPGGYSAAFGGEVVAPRTAGLLILAGAVLAALKVSGIRFNVGM